MEKGLTSYVLNYLLSTCFDSKADMARQLDMSKRALQRVMNEPQLSKGGSVALVKAAASRWSRRCATARGTMFPWTRSCANMRHMIRMNRKI